MTALTRFWRWWTETWRAPRRARWLYIVMGLGFAALALLAALDGDPAIAAVAGVAGVVTVVLAARPRWLSRWMNPPEDTQ